MNSYHDLVWMLAEVTHDLAPSTFLRPKFQISAHPKLESIKTAQSTAKPRNSALEIREHKNSSK